MNKRTEQALRNHAVSDQIKKDTGVSESALSDLLYLTLWIHGTAGSPDKPCNEVDVIEFTGARIRVEFIEFVMNLDGVDIMVLLKGLPTENWLSVQVLPFNEDDGSWSFEVKNYEIDSGI